MTLENADFGDASVGASIDEAGRYLCSTIITSTVSRGTARNLRLWGSGAGVPYLRHVQIAVSEFAQRRSE